MSISRNATFPTAQCSECGKSVLTYIALNDDGTERRVCVHCDTPVRDDDVTWVSPGELEQTGYYFGPPPDDADKGGCSSGCGSCAVRKN